MNFTNISRIAQYDVQAVDADNASKPRRAGERGPPRA